MLDLEGVVVVRKTAMLAGVAVASIVEAAYVFRYTVTAIVEAVATTMMADIGVVVIGICLYLSLFHHWNLCPFSELLSLPCQYPLLVTYLESRSVH